mgnify:CR=1 FL=1
MNFKNNAIGLVSAASIALLAGSVVGQDGKTGAPGLLSAGTAAISVQETSFGELPQGMMGDLLCVSFDGQESWDALDDPDNIILDLDIGADNMLSAVGWDIGIATVGGSWLSEATIQHSSSAGSADPNAINLAVGAGEDAAGDQDFTSGGGLLIFADNELPNIVPGDDGILRLQMFDSFDDNVDAIDANYRNAAEPALCPEGGLGLLIEAQPEPPVTQSVPANNPWALALLIALLAGLGVVAVRRFA